MESRKAELLQRIESDRDVLIDFLRRFIRCPSPNPPGDTGEAAGHIRNLLDQRPAPGVLRPALAVADREHVDMAVECEVVARLRGRERRDDVRHRLLRRDHAIFDAAPIQQIADMRRRRARVAGWVGAGAADESAQKIDQHVAVALDPLQQLILATRHLPILPGDSISSSLGRRKPAAQGA